MTGKTLVHRTTRSVSLSDDGLRLVAELNEPFGQLRDIFTGACDEAGRCGNAAPDRAGGLSRQQLVPAIAPFCISIPSCICSLRSPTGWSLASEGFDLAIRHCRREALLIPTSPAVVSHRDAYRRVRRLYSPPWPPGDPRRSAPPPMPDLSPWATAPAVDVRLPSVARCSGDHQRAGAIRHQ